MKIKRLLHVSDYRVFDGFSWPTDLPQFEDYNLVYGWNASGKTTLASIFRELETRRRLVACGDYELETDEGTIRGRDVDTGGPLPDVRVFNRDFVLETVFTATGEVPPILYVGKESVEKQKEIEHLREEGQRKLEEIVRVGTQLQQTEKDLDNLRIESAKLVKEALRSGGASPYNNYDKSDFKKKSDELNQNESSSFLLSEEEREKLRARKNVTPRAKIHELQTKLELGNGCFREINAILTRAVASRTLERLKNDPEVGLWVENGLRLHEARLAKSCLFCQGNLDKELLNRLQEHFGDDYAETVAMIDRLLGEVDAKIEEVRHLIIPSPSELYDHLQLRYSTAKTALDAARGHLIAGLLAIAEKLREKRRAPFGMIAPEADPPASAQSQLENLNSVIRVHNQESIAFDAGLKQARERLEADLVASALPNVIELERRFAAERDKKVRLEGEKRQLEEKIAVLEREITEHRLPAEELSRDLAAYLGREELRFEVEGAGYRLRRNGEIAEGLSEGERSAIALLYFLKSLGHKGFALENAIVVIDDPVSSLDSNAFFCSFSFLKERAKKAGQLFVLTHHFGLFRETREWFKYTSGERHGLKKDQRRTAAYYFLCCETNGSGRQAKLDGLDPLLKDYDSEYQYLFKLVYTRASNEADGTLANLYHFPNVARRLLEAFLAFRRPAHKGSLRDRLADIDFEETKKARILRHLDVHSHSDGIRPPEGDLVILCETPAALNDLLELMKKEDPDHFKRMLDAIGAEGAG
jgi:wobble nucleotide-excising tRNase